MLAREGDDGLIGTLSLLQILPEGVKILDDTVNPAGHHHGARRSADFAMGLHLVVEMIDHDLRLLSNGMVVGLDIASEFLLRPLGVELRVVLYRLH